MLALVLAAAAALAPAQRFEFDEDHVEGDVVRPESEIVSGAQKVRHASLIRVRRHFIDEIIQSANR